SIDLKTQLFSQSRVLFIAAIAMGCTMFIGFPPVQTSIVCIAMIALAVILNRKTKAMGVAAAAETEQAEEVEMTGEASYYKNIDNVYNLLNVEQVEMEFGYSLIPLVDEASGGNFIDRVVMFRKQFALEMGMVVPSVRLKDSGQLNPNQYAIKFKGETVAVGDVLVDHFLALPPTDGEDTIEGIETIEPAFGIPAKWISEDKRIKAELAGYTLIDPTSVIITHLSEVIRTHAHELLTRQEVGNMLTNMKKVNEPLVNEVIPNIVSASELQKVLSLLLYEGVPIRDLETIIETLADYGPVVKDTDMLTEYVRQSLRRTISHKFAESGQLKVISLDAEIENQIMASVKKVDNGSYLALEPQIIQQIVSSTKAEIDKIHDLVQSPIILTSPIVRIYFKKLMDQFFPGTTVLSFNEIENDIQVQALGNITIQGK
ncbi:MAG: flagellar biosynthesis protein FlhA, partial [Oscillospiraceae bacterium]